MFYTKAESIENQVTMIGNNNRLIYLKKQPLFVYMR